jgi:hypothetical protein
LSGHLGGVGPGHELVDLAGKVAVDEAAEDVGEVAVGVDRIELAGLDQRGDDAPVDAALIGAGEQRVLPVMSTSTSGIMHSRRLCTAPAGA